MGEPAYMLLTYVVFYYTWLHILVFINRTSTIKSDYEIMTEICLIKT